MNNDKPWGVPLEESPDRALVSDFLKPRIVSFRYNSFYRKELNMGEFTKDLTHLVSILEDSSNKEVYSQLKAYVFKHAEFKTAEHDSRLQELAEVVKKWSLKFYKTKGIDSPLSPFSCQYTSFISPPVNLLKKLSGIVCSDYAFLQLGEERSYQTFLSEFSSDVCSLETINEWGYSVVEEPQPGDLVIYHDGSKDVHYGIWNQNGKVVSKWGMGGEVYEHPLNLVLKDYGTHVSFHRKPVYQETLQALKKHSETDITIEEFKLYAQELIRNKLDKCYNASYAFKFFTEWSEQLISIDSQTVEKFLEQAKNFAEEAKFEIVI